MRAIQMLKATTPTGSRDRATKTHPKVRNRSSRRTSGLNTTQNFSEVPEQRWVRVPVSHDSTHIGPAPATWSSLSSSGPDMRDLISLSCAVHALCPQSCLALRSHATRGSREPELRGYRNSFSGRGSLIRASTLQEPSLPPSSVMRPHVLHREKSALNPAPRGINSVVSRLARLLLCVWTGPAAVLRCMFAFSCRERR